MNEQPFQPEAGLLAEAEAFKEYLRQQRRIPGATYRLQLHPGFTFRGAAALVPYLARLGVTDCYCSPFFQARPGSNHGYDICDYSRLNAELGSEADFQAFADALAAHQMGLVLDFVPNHMAVDALRNPWWRSVLESGQASPYAQFFDIDWDPIKPELRGKVLLSFLGDHYGLVLERGDLKLALENGALALRYFDLDWAVDPHHYPRVFRVNLEALQADLKEDDPQLQEFLSVLTAFDHLPLTTETAPERVAERQREIKVACERLGRVLDACPRLRQHIDSNLQIVNGQAGKPESFDRLHELLEEQAYRLAFWRTAFHEINYRRFFDINMLAGLRMEEPAVFAATHELVLRLIRERKITGLRLDHLDGLFDPAGYLDRLQEAILLERAAAFCRAPEGGREQVGCVRPSEVTESDQEPAKAERTLPVCPVATVHAWREQERRNDPRGPAVRPLYVVAEKILSGTETLALSWPIHGTTGYDFLNDLTRLFVDASNAKAMRKVYERFTGRLVPFADVGYECKKLITETALASELYVLAHALNRLSEGDRRARDFTLISLHDALREVVACFPVYRTYVGDQGATETDEQMIDLALRRARHRNPAMEATVFDFIRAVLLPQKDKLSEDEYQRCLHFAMKFQQYTGPVQAKGIEDTAFYRYHVLVSLNEVGGDPQRFGGTIAQFHDANRRRLAGWPQTLLSTATHDTKRGEDARARLNVLSEMPDEWRRRVGRWARNNARNRDTVDGEPAPDRNDEYLFYQALLGAWPAEPAGTRHETAPADLIERLRQYMLKAVKEAKVHTSWINPNEAYDRAVAAFMDKTLAGPRAPRFLADFLPFQRRVAQLGVLNSLAQVVLKIVSPGVPDFFQGTELWDLSLVDPDNRRPVDFAHRSRLLESLEPLLREPAPATDKDQTIALTEMMEHWHDGRIKLFITAAGLRLRRRLPNVFFQGDYLPLETQGECAENVVALSRRYENDVVIAVVPRFVNRLIKPDQPLAIARERLKSATLALPANWEQLHFRNAFTQQTLKAVSRIPVAELLAGCPVALLESVEGPTHG
jgi:(1->4)-alpha-D-glucan 1-alpha-D-glucosylmutase